METTTQSVELTVSAYLAADHDRLDTILADARRMAEEGELERAEHTFDELVVGLGRHIGLEEALLFPAFDHVPGAPKGPTQVMRHEHRTITDLLTRMSAALAKGQAAAFEASAVELVAVLGPHNVKEERVIYPFVDQHLPPGDRAALLARMRGFPAI
jgi:regulator of cell morphogenesis and NO signaling